MTVESQFMIDGINVPFTTGQTIMDAAAAAHIYIPHLCHHPDFTPHGSCKLCTVNVNGRNCSACTFPAENGQQVLNQTAELNTLRKRIMQMLFIEGNHLCPACEKSGNCKLQATAYQLGMVDSHFPHFYKAHEVDSSHPDIMLDRNRCIFCTLCVRASRDVDGKDLFAISGRGINKHLVINSPSGALQDSGMAVTDRAADICPTGALLIKHRGFAVPIGKRIYDNHPICEDYDE